MGTSVTEPEKETKAIFKQNYQVELVIAEVLNSDKKV